MISEVTLSWTKGQSSRAVDVKVLYLGEDAIIDRDHPRPKAKVLWKFARRCLAFLLLLVFIGLLAVSLVPSTLVTKSTAFPSNEALGGEPDAIVILVHGTFAPRAGWTQQNSLIVSTIQQRFDGIKVQFYQFDWAGSLFDASNNSHFHRFAASEKLSELVAKLRLDHPAARLLLVAHSHGGNVALYAGKKDQRVDAIVTMGTPFIEVRPRDLDGDIALLGTAEIAVYIAWFAMLLGSTLLDIIGIFFGGSLIERDRVPLKVLGGVVVFFSLILVAWPLEPDGYEQVLVANYYSQPAGSHYETRARFRASDEAEKMRADWAKALIAGIKALGESKQSDLISRLSARMPSNIPVLCLRTKEPDEALVFLDDVVPLVGIPMRLLSSPHVGIGIAAMLMLGCLGGGLFAGVKLAMGTLRDARAEGKISAGMVAASLFSGGVLAFAVAAILVVVVGFALVIVTPLSVVARGPASIPFLLAYGSADLIAEYVTTTSSGPMPIEHFAGGSVRQCEVKEYDFSAAPQIKHSWYYMDTRAVGDVADWLRARYGEGR